MEGFFSRVELATVETPMSRFPLCGKCKLDKTCVTPKMPIRGRGRKSIMIIGEAPVANEDREGKPFIGDAGMMLQKQLRRNNVDMFRDCWIQNALSCRPPNNVIKNRRSIEYCRPKVIQGILDKKPNVIILLGLSAVESVLRHIWKEKGGIGKMGRWTGWSIPYQKWNTWICPAVHPSYLLRQRNDPVAESMFNQQIRNAIKISRRPPWKKIPEFEKNLILIDDPSQIRPVVKKLMRGVDTIAFDYETNCLSPYKEYAKIVCCSISNGEWSVAFQWAGPHIRYIKRILNDPDIRKIGWNAKFEDSWTRRVAGTEVRGWMADGMLSSHLLDCRSRTTGLKFQAFVRLGMPNYSNEVEPYMQAKGNSDYNRIDDVATTTLLRYCALDSLLEYRIGQQQMEEFEDDPD